MSKHAVLRHLRPLGAALALLSLVADIGGCVERRMTIRSNPPGAAVYVDDYQIGTTPVATDYTYYGTRKVRLVKDGFETLTVYQPMPAPWYDVFGVDFFSENIWPGKIRDERAYDYQMTPQIMVSNDQLLARADQLRKSGAIPGPVTVPVAAPPPTLPPTTTLPPEGVIAPPPQQYLPPPGTYSPPGGTVYPPPVNTAPTFTPPPATGPGFSSPGGFGIGGGAPANAGTMPVFPEMSPATAPNYVPPSGPTYTPPAAPPTSAPPVSAPPPTIPYSVPPGWRPMGQLPSTDDGVVR